MKYCFFALSLCILSLVTTTAAINATQRKGFFYVSPDNNLSYDLFQTHNGIISHSIEGNASRYSLIDLQSKEVKLVLADLSKACDPATPIFQNLHHHVPTDSLVYFCSQNNSLLVLNQESLSIQAAIPFNLQGKWSAAKLSTDGVNVAVLLIGDLFSIAPQPSVLVKVDVQAKQLSTVMTLNQFLDHGEAVVAFTANIKSAYVATNRIQGSDLLTAIYSFVTIGNTYQLTELSRFNATLDSGKFVTKLFLVGNLVAVNNGQDLYFIGQKGISQTVEKLAYKSITSGLSDLAVTSPHNSNDLYYLVNGSVYRAIVTAGIIRTVKIGDFEDMQVAYGNSTSGDLMFTLDSSRMSFSILDLQTLKPVYSSLASYNATIMLANSTYSTIQTGQNGNNDTVYIFNLTTDSLVARIPLPKNYTYTAEQNLISYWNRTTDLFCNITHVNLSSGQVWTNPNGFYGKELFLCDYAMITFKMDYVGSLKTPQFAVQLQDSFYVYMSWGGGGKAGSSSANPQTVLLDTVALTSSEFNIYEFEAKTNRVFATAWGHYPKYATWYQEGANWNTNTSASRGFFAITQYNMVALSSDIVTLIYGLGAQSDTPNEQYPNSGDWNTGGAFHDGYCYNFKCPNDWMILSKDGLNPALLTYGGFIPLPGFRNESIKANSAGHTNYWIEDAPSASVRSVRFFDVYPEVKVNERITSLRPIDK